MLSSNGYLIIMSIFSVEHGMLLKFFKMEKKIANLAFFLEYTWNADIPFVIEILG